MRRTVPLLIIACLVANALPSLVCIRANDFARIAATKEAVRQLGEASALPAGMVNGLVREENPLSAGINADEKKAHGRSGNHDFLLNGASQKSGNEAGRFAGVPGGGPAASGFAVVYASDLLHHWPPGWCGFICLLFLAYIVVLFRSNLPGESAIACVCRV